MNNIVTVQVLTKLGETYSFPGMPSAEVLKLIDHLKTTQIGQLLLVNLSHSTLTVPARIIYKILVDGEEKYACSTA